MSFLTVLFYSLIPYGQLWTRIVNYSGSVDQPWYFFPLFLFPPLQFIPVILLNLGYIKEGKGGKVYDNFVWIPIATKFIMQFFGRMFIPDEYYHWISEILILSSIIVAKYLHSNDSCKVAKKEISSSFTNFQTILIDAVFENGVAGIFNVIIGFLPVIGWALMAISMVESLNNIMVFLFWMAGYLFIYTLQNMFEQDNMDHFCNPLEITTFNIIKFVAGLILSGIAYLNESLDPIAMASGMASGVLGDVLGDDDE